MRKLLLLTLLSCAASGALAQTPIVIQNLPPAGTLTGSEQVPIEQGRTVQTTVGALSSFSTSSLTSSQVVAKWSGTCTPSASIFLATNGTCQSGVGSGTVTSVGLTVPSWLSVSNSPVTSSGTLAVSSASGLTANQFLATPNGSSGTLSMRAIAAADLPAGTSGAGAALAYSPSSGSVDPGAGITGFVAATGPLGTGRLKVTLSANTTFAGLPAGADGQLLYVTVVSGSFTLTLTAGGSTSGAPMYASTSYNLALRDTLHFVYDTGLTSWVLVP